MESLIITLLIDTHEGRDMDIFEIPGAHLQAKLAPNPNNERVLLKLVGDFVDMMCQVNPEHKNNVMYENGRFFLHMQVFQIIYG